MTKEELICKQQLEIEQYKITIEEYKKSMKEIKGRFYNIGQPLNDNVLGFNKDQIKWALVTVNLIY